MPSPMVPAGQVQFGPWHTVQLSCGGCTAGARVWRTDDAVDGAGVAGTSEVFMVIDLEESPFYLFRSPSKGRKRT